MGATSSNRQQAENFIRIKKLSTDSGRGIVLRYEDLIENFDHFAKGLTTHMDFPSSAIRQIYQQTRPKGEEDPTSHRRSGAVGDFRKKLKAETVVELNERLKEILSHFGYKP